jgi:drug/metabolite transporter (DMT)-like permease
VIGGVILFREIPDLLSWLGVAAILSSCLLAAEPASRGQESRA